MERVIKPRQMFGLVRTISRSLASCELLHLPRQELDVEIARHQHQEYVAALEAAGVIVTILPEEPELPDSVFVEDPIIMLDEVAVICRLGSPSRASESAGLDPIISAIRPIRRILEPGTIEGGDVLRMVRTLYVGISSRTNRVGLQQLKEFVVPFGYRVVEVEVHGCLHLKTGITSPAEGLVIVNPDWIDVSPFRDLQLIRVPAAEPWGANTLAVNGWVFVADAFPRTSELLESKGLRVKRLGISEIQRAEAGLTCLSLLYTGQPH